MTNKQQPPHTLANLSVMPCIMNGFRATFFETIIKIVEKRILFLVYLIIAIPSFGIMYYYDFFGYKEYEFWGLCAGILAILIMNMLHRLIYSIIKADWMKNMSKVLSETSTSRLKSSVTYQDLDYVNRAMAFYIAWSKGRNPELISKARAVQVFASDQQPYPEPTQVF